MKQRKLNVSFFSPFCDFCSTPTCVGEASLSLSLPLSSSSTRFLFLQIDGVIAREGEREGCWACDCFVQQGETGLCGRAALYSPSIFCSLSSSSSFFFTYCSLSSPSLHPSFISPCLPQTLLLLPLSSFTPHLMAPLGGKRFVILTQTPPLSSLHSLLYFCFFPLSSLFSPSLLLFHFFSPPFVLPSSHSSLYFFLLFLAPSVYFLFCLFSYLPPFFPSLVFSPLLLSPVFSH